MDSDNESYRSESEFYYLGEEKVIQENKKFDVFCRPIKQQIKPFSIFFEFVNVCCSDLKLISQVELYFKSCPPFSLTSISVT